ncbi:ABC transporter permease [Thermophagus sp. OGC60D27]|uniref:ABC transporter permease n=1 Tax=Thermophagus sp. OGC60D27 TaxID=3458415 RepID=UPI0040378B5C
MKLELFISNKIRTGGISGKRLARPVIRVSIAGIILGMVVMIISIATGMGFQKEIREKIIGFGSHIQVVSYDFNLSFETNPIKQDSALEQQLKEVPGVLHLQRFATKPGILKTKDQMQGMILRGVGPEFDWSFFRTILKEGKVLTLKGDKTSPGILISDEVARMLHLKVGDKAPMYFFENQIRARNFKVEGIFDSNLPDLDKTFIICDIRQVQRLNNWKYNQISGYELLTGNFENIMETGALVADVASAYISPNGDMLRTRSILQTQPQIFGWLDLLDMNITVIIGLIILVAGFNMITGLLILILERTNMIGILKAMGMADWPLRKVFLILASQIALKGLFWGNLIGLILCWAQKQFELFKLNPENYFLETVPIHLTWTSVLLLNAGAIIAIFLMMIGPSYLAARISPVKAIRFE